MSMIGLQRFALLNLLDRAVAQLDLVHSDALDQARGSVLHMDGDREFSCYQINRCAEVAAAIRHELKSLLASDDANEVPA